MKISIGDLVEISNGYAFKSSKYVESGVRIIRITNVQKGEIKDDTPKFYPKESMNEKSNFLIESGDILMSLTGNVGRVGIFPKELMPAFLNQRVAKLRIKSNRLDKKFLYYYLNSDDFERKAIDNSSGVAQLNLSTKWVNDYKIPLPPLDQQKKIANILDTADAYRQKTKALIEKYDELTQSLFLDMFGDPVINPKGWEVDFLDKITTKIGSGSTPKGGKQAYKKEGIALIRSMNVYDNWFKYKGLAYIDQEQATKLKNVIVEKGDVLFNITGASICRSSVVPSDVLPARVNQHVSIIRPITSKITSMFLSRFLISTNVKIKLLGVGSGGGAVMEAITKEQLKSIEVITPPIDLQNLFTERVQAIEAQKALAEASLNQAEDLFNSLLQRAFKG